MPAIPELIQAALAAIDAHAEEVTELDKTLGDGDHVTNLQRGLKALLAQSDELAALDDWSQALQKMAMTLMSQIGGASGSLYATLFMTLAKQLKGKEMNLANFAEALEAGVEAMKQRGRSDVGEKTMLDTLVPVAAYLKRAAGEGKDLNQVLEEVKAVATEGMESTRDMLATKGRASYLGERARGIVDAGARTGQLMICAVADRLAEEMTR
ncbi:phosphoenolpyruvate---glycerone phosphotransferase subunit DhaL [Methylomarinovum caldicuralii]|uniref:Phosphoenolpyruvate---glycerone phosphotransferase subunit DhaL n=1 Tax=Methylomarinovum caldicuralii TaxID=438856 RepID=A0AAU9BYX4_9GAMM|nr:dihydroxyacetone kinase subunit DhaL [Methylomarinovum caldicuralii]BCX81287.1 phosphoenolpyruvate---glycerone phosphotransferase subunit DhaL [Methylomarinovum caldicuralii]